MFSFKRDSEGSKALRWGFWVTGQSPIIFLLLFLFCTQSLASPVTEKLHERAKNLYDVEDYNAALDLYGRILILTPGDGAAMDLSGWSHKYLGDFKSAEEMFEKALTVLQGEDAVWVLIGLGEIYLDSSIYDDALACFEDAIKAAPDNVEASERASRGAAIAREALKPPVPEPEPEPKLRPEVEAKPKPKPTPATPAPKKAVTNKEDRQKAEFTKKAPPAPEPQKPAPLPTVYGVTLGSNIEEALTKLERAGYSLDGESFLKGSKVYFPIKSLPASLPGALAGALSGHFYVTAYNDAVLSVIVQLEYGKTRSFEDLKGDLEGAFSELTGKSDRRGVNTSNNIFSYEIGMAVSKSYGIWTYATDKGDGTCRAEIEHVDLTNLSHYWMAGGK